MSAKTAVDGVAGLLASVSGLERVYNPPPASIQETPCAVVYLDGSELVSVSRSEWVAIHTVAADIVLNEGSFSDNVGNTMPYVDRVYNELASHIAGGASYTGIQFPVDVRVEPVQYGDRTYLMARFTIPVKDVEAIT